MEVCALYSEAKVRLSNVTHEVDTNADKAAGRFLVDIAYTLHDIVLGAGSSFICCALITSTVQDYLLPNVQERRYGTNERHNCHVLPLDELAVQHEPAERLGDGGQGKRRFLA